MIIDYGGKRGKKKSGNMASGKWDVRCVRELCERNKKNKWYMYLSTSGVKLVCICPLLLRVIVEQL